jgi:predicted acetylornithine/succinylornithine family transaminase
MGNQELIEIASRNFLANYRQAPVVLVAGERCRVSDADGRRYLDLCGGIAVISVGHAHPAITKAVADQAARITHTSNLFYNERSIELAAELAKRTVFPRYFFCNSGAEANESLLKLSRRFHYERGDTERVELITAIASFHGRTMGALSMTGQPKYHKGMEPLVPGIRHVPFGDLAALGAAVTSRTAAVVLEPIQGEGGVSVASDEYLRGARALCDQRGALLMFDEVQTGFGRTGRFLAREHSGVVPDACALAKGIASGLPLGAIAVSEKLAHGLPPGTHASTFGGNPVACAASLAVLRVFDEEKLVENSENVGQHLGQRLQALVSKLACVDEARGRGLLRGVKLAQGIDPAGVLAKARERGVLLSIAGADVVRFTPPLCVTPAEIDEGVDALTKVLEDPPKAGG